MSNSNNFVGHNSGTDKITNRWKALNEYFLFEKYDTLNKLVYFALSFGGLMDRAGNKKWFPIYTCYHVSCLHIWTAATIIELAVGSREVRDVVGTLSTMVTAICAIIRAMRFFFRKKEIISILERLDILRLKMLNDEDNKHILLQTEIIGRKILTAVFISLNGFPIASFFWFTFCDYLYDFKEQHIILRVKEFP
ncbi:hypothetical protein O3M35_002569 [Rhynocoris fuscipes]|uniref:Uncharacterized protein n=1 Tax=Rhynocoris fuscipes TaxID=488301 RepID=A0AAW1CRS6_9HEMI